MEGVLERTLWTGGRGRFSCHERSTHTTLRGKRPLPLWKGKHSTGVPTKNCSRRELSQEISWTGER